MYTIKAYGEGQVEMAPITHVSTR